MMNLYEVQYIKNYSTMNYICRLATESHKYNIWVAAYLSACMWLLQRVACHIFVSSSDLAREGLLATETNIITVCPFLVAWSTASGLDMSILVKSMDGFLRRCSGSSSSGRGSSSSSHWSNRLEVYKS